MREEAHARTDPNAPWREAIEDCLSRLAGANTDHDMTDYYAVTQPVLDKLAPIMRQAFRVGAKEYALFDGSVKQSSQHLA
jgi:hypothetical protein